MKNKNKEPVQAIVKSYFNNGKITKSGNSYIFNKENIASNSSPLFFDIFYNVILEVAERSGVELSEGELVSKSRELDRFPDGKYNLYFNEKKTLKIEPYKKN